ncbi:hypothetical protein, partial [Vibrio coralliirubri]|uniref:hypothetical protein n=1 Tax=Vibrio coralliirubri TaxID=1516159 RepID=UPI001E6418AD
ELHPTPSLPTARNERDRKSRLWFEIPDTSFLGSGMTPRNRVDVRFFTSSCKELQSRHSLLRITPHTVIPYSEERTR